MDRLRRLWRAPGGTGAVMAAVAIPLIVLFPAAGILVVLITVFVYPAFDVIHILRYRSWWRGVLIAAPIWFVLFVLLVGIADARRPMREDAMVFLFPFMLYPIAIAVSGVVRLQGRAGGRSRESDVRIAGIVCGLLVLAPILLSVVPDLVSNITGNTPANTVISGDGEVVTAAAADRVDVRIAGKTEAVHFGAATKFGFQGPGSAVVTGTAGPEWLKPGQKVNVSYVYRRHEAQAEGIYIWIDRKGCADQPKWAAVSQAASSPPTAASLAGTAWASWLGDREQPGQHDETTFEFLDGNRVTYDSGFGKHTDGQWRQNDASVLIQVNDCYAFYEGRVDGDEIKGQFSNIDGARTNWTAQRKAK
jgi:hypothetical protein